MSNIKKCNNKHLTLSQRIVIEKGLEGSESFSLLARKTGKNPSTISKEIQRHIIYHVKSELGRDIPCANRPKCVVRSLCNSVACFNLCNRCAKPNFFCSSICKDYVEKACEKLNKPPYVCNGCIKKSRCFLKKSYYSAKCADDSYHDLLISSREGINQEPVDVAMLDALISPLLKQGQSLAHIYANHASEIPCCRKTLYNYIDQSVFSARNIDMRRRVRYKVRRKPTRVSITARKFRNGRTYDDFSKLMKENPNTPVVEMDTVVGGRKKGKAFLTMLFRSCSLMLMFLLEEKTAECVAAVFDWMSEELSVDVFNELFPVILTDNGAEFQNPLRLEGDINGEVRTKLYYCNPHSSWQKGMLEKNHEYIRLVIPKGQSLDGITEKDTRLIMNHINSESRDKLNGCTPFVLSKMLLNTRLHKLLKLKSISPDNVTLHPKLLK